MRGAGTRTRTLMALAAATIAAATLSSGCVWVSGGQAPPGAGSTADTSATAKGAASAGAAEGHTPVLMLGRSVMRGWFEHWGWDGDGPVYDHGYAFTYAEVASPPEIAEDAAARVAAVEPGTIVVFKLCFADFWASSAGEVEENVEECLGYARRVADAAEERGVPLVLGNALPRVRGETSPALIDVHERYNAGLAKLAEERDGVVVLDLYGTLVGHDGALAKGLAASPEDSHLNDEAYALLDGELYEALGSLR